LQQQLNGFGAGSLQQQLQQLQQQQLSSLTMTPSMCTPVSMHSSPNGGMNGGGGGGAQKNPPPANYVCHKCNIMGHWIQECPLNTQGPIQDYTKPPPVNYVCHRCGIPGHWIKNCPTNGNTGFDNKPHLKDPSKSSSSSMLNSMPNLNGAQDQQSADNATENNVAVQPPSKKRRLNQL